MTTKSNPTDTADREIVISRDFDAPRELVWQAMTDPKHVVNWWGPNGFSDTIEDMEVRPGGVWKHILRGPDGANYPNRSVFKEVVKPERVVFSHGGRREDGPGTTFEASWTFEALAAKKTRLTIRMVFPSTDARDFVVKEFGAVEGGKQTLGRLAAYLEKSGTTAALTESGREFVITRTFDAPREIVWAAWTDPKQMAVWWGPKDFANPVCEMDVRAGGKYNLTMRSPDGADYPIKGTFLEVTKPEKLVMSMDASDHPDEWHDMVNPNRDKSKKPHLELVQTVTFEDLNGRTRLTIRSQLESTTIRDNMVNMGMNEGWSSSLDRLAEVVAGRGVPLVFERTYNAPAAAVWKAITDKDAMKQWYFDLKEFKPEVGFEFQFSVDHDGFTYDHRCKVTAVAPGRKIAYTWRYEGHAGDSEVTFELLPEGNKTKLRLTHEGVGSFPQAPAFVRTNFMRGWTQLLGTSLKAFVEKT